MSNAAVELGAAGWEEEAERVYVICGRRRWNMLSLPTSMAAGTSTLLGSTLPLAAHSYLSG